MSTNALIASIDQGTSSTRFIVFSSETGKIVASHQVEVEQLYPKPGWVEIRANDLLTTTYECIENVAKQLEADNISVKQIRCVGITNQRGLYSFFFVSNILYLLFL